MNALYDTWIMTKRSLRHTFRSMDTIITVVAMPIGIMLLFVYVFGGAISTGLGSVKYIDFAVPGVVIMTVVSGIAYAAFRLSLDVNNGFINRFRSMPVSPSSILGGQVLSSVISNMFSVLLVIIVALLIGFRTSAGLMALLIFVGILLLLATALTWVAVFFGLLAKTAEGAGAFSYILLGMVFVSSAFIPTTNMGPALKAFANNQPFTPIIQTLRSLLINGTAGKDVWLAVTYCVVILVVSYFLALRTYKTKTA